ncbi:hypothetical protein C900_05031 [Fulvivirga imtechensis AK7]|uniref:Uncharacterized protein n=1 Tax=Fulvivirga imtechensis AK7 TaxID=1237149 RepID=L8JPR0_9BACT|nr:ACT domain-containing protein [Fulvivirga imtechensis]ELR69499.1 hypothetical protein C900_05031 [Fulvivirga imtechensis AK7]
MAGETDLVKLVKGMKPQLNAGEYVFSLVDTMKNIPPDDVLCLFREKEGITVILEREEADLLNLKYDYVASWITLMVHSSLEAVGLTAVFSSELAKHHISCNVVAGYYHDHIFVDKKQEQQAIEVLVELTKKFEG